MFETAELERKLSRHEYKERVPALRAELLEAQRQLREEASFPVILVFAGVDGAGKGEIVNLLSSWLDPRWLVTRAYEAPSEEERERPEYWRYWRDLPPKGQIGLFLSSWYSVPILNRVAEGTQLSVFDEQLDRIVAFEEGLADDGAMILKFWLHLDKAAQKKRFKKLEKDPQLSWRVTETDWKHWRMYDKFVEAAERTLRKTSTGQAPWKIVEGFDLGYSSTTIGTMISEEILKHLGRARRRAAVLQAHREAEAEAQAAVAAVEAEAEATATEGDRHKQPQAATVLSALDMDKSLAKGEYNKLLNNYQGELNQLHRRARERKLSALLVFEGADAAGKGGAIRRITGALDARSYQVIPIAAPTDEERAQHYLWRFWRHLPRGGRITIFDRSWYGRVLVERVEGFASETDWMRAYAEINDFEEQLVEYGIVLVKYWVHISAQEQLERFQAREQTPHKAWKLTDEDWRNREKWGAYELAVNDMVERTSTRIAPWTLIEGNDKRYARVAVLRTLCERLEQALGKAGDGKK
ncbi:MAG TPA: polyphosphate:AMP phosphotransferase [Gammaproteobacteria bacterium]